MNSEAAVVWDDSGPIIELTLNRPDARNALNEAMIEALEQAVAKIEHAADVRVVIITGGPDCFCAGVDLRTVTAHQDHPVRLFRLHDRLVQLVARVERLRTPVIAALAGSAFGGGAELALACDFRIIAASAKLGFPESRLGIMPGAGGTARLARIIGREKALFLELTGSLVTAEEALSMGMVLRVVPDGEVLVAARNLARTIARNAPLAVEFIKRAVRHSSEMALDNALDHCQLAALWLGNTRDAREGIAAFLERRDPNWVAE